jgi:cell division protein FtsZ
VNVRAAEPPRAGGSSLFERMAGFGRPAAVEEEPEDEPERGAQNGSTLRIPRFLGRQNNQ